jgi:long-chain acyl-CoA synthetase
MCTLVAAASSVVLPGFEVDSGLKHIEEDKVTFLGEFAPMLKMLLDRADERGSDISSLKHIFGLDSPDTITRFQEATGGTFWSVYGQSETSGLISAAPYSERPGSAGLPFPLAEVGIVDEHGNLVAAGISGEIVVRGPMVFRGYWDLDNETEYTFRDNFHHTGDIGYVDGDGYLWFKGRAPEKDLIKSGGENVYPTEVEKVVLGHPSVKDAVVIGVPDSRWGEAVRAVCELNKGESTSEAELIEFVGTHIAGFKKPKSVVFVSKLPTKEDGSVDREKVKEEFGRG